MDFTGVNKAHGPSTQPTACRFFVCLYVSFFLYLLFRYFRIPLHQSLLSPLFLSLCVYDSFLSLSFSLIQPSPTHALIWNMPIYKFPLRRLWCKWVIPNLEQTLNETTRCYCYCCTSIHLLLWDYPCLNLSTNGSQMESKLNSIWLALLGSLLSLILGHNLRPVVDVIKLFLEEIWKI